MTNRERLILLLESEFCDEDIADIISDELMNMQKKIMVINAENQESHT
jgi:hypothetical protein